MEKLTICMPTYNEKENLEQITKALYKVMKKQSYNTTLLVVDDNSPDGTGKIADKLSQKYTNDKFRVEVIHRKGKLGLASAYLRAFKKALESKSDFIMSMDADFSHQPKYVPQMLTELKKGNDVVIGSRYVKGGGVEDWSIIRQIISKGGGLYARTILGVKIKDFTGGFNLFKREALDSIDLDNIESEGYSFQIEIKYILAKQGLEITEFPIIFPDRKFGKAKMNTKIMIEALWRMWKIRFS
jgi:dolichol-phosphate mannosyltransferase